MNTINLNDMQLAEVERLKSSGKYPEMYLFIKNLVDLELSNTRDPVLQEDFAIASNWLYTASKINANDGSFFNEMVRGSMAFAAASKGRP